MRHFKIPPCRNFGWNYWNAPDPQTMKTDTLGQKLGYDRCPYLSFFVRRFEGWNLRFDGKEKLKYRIRHFWPKTPDTNGDLTPLGMTWFHWGKRSTMWRFCLLLSSEVDCRGLNCSWSCYSSKLVTFNGCYGLISSFKFDCYGLNSSLLRSKL